MISHSNHLARLPVESKPCPNPACMEVMVQANTYVHQKLAGHLAANYTPLFTSPAYQVLREHITTALLAGDLEATKVACRQWCRLVTTWTRAHTAGNAERDTQILTKDAA